jgi:group I intron endonuclease
MDSNSKPQKQSKYPDGDGIYAITNIQNGRVYIGRGTFAMRWRQHRYLLRKGTHYNPDLQKDWIEYGEDMFTFTVIEVAPHSSNRYCLRGRERFHISRTPNMYNCDSGTRMFRS